MEDLRRATEDACSYLLQYGNSPFDQLIVDALDELGRLNDALYHGCNADVIKSITSDLRQCLDTIERDLTRQ